jgi:hypothetical protein
MADLICVAFEDPTTADRALTELTALQKEYLIELKDACVVVRSPDGEVHLHQAVPAGQDGGAHRRHVRRALGHADQAPFPQPARRYGDREPGLRIDPVQFRGAD